MDTETQVVDDVPATFAQLVTALAPRRFALSGGRTAARCYRALGSLAGDWSATTFLLSDERWVPLDHPASNEGQARREWLDSITTGAVWSLRGAGAEVEEAADNYHRVLTEMDDVELLHLGLGDDGHIASLFPGSPALEVTDRLVVAISDDRHEWSRLTFTYPAIARCRTAIVTATGRQKREAFRRVRAGDPFLPATHIRPRRLVWLVDRAVAGDV